MNRYTTVATGRHAKSVFRDEAEVIELADTLVRRTRHPRLMLWVAWLVINADGKITDAERLLFQRLTRLARELHQVDDEQLANVVNIDPDEVWRRVDAEPGDISDVVYAAERVATVDGDLNTHERAVIGELRGSLPATLTRGVAAGGASLEAVLSVVTFRRSPPAYGPNHVDVLRCVRQVGFLRMSLVRHRAPPSSR